MTERPSPDPTHSETRAKLLDLSLPQLIGGSLAAATAAALGSRLGVVGTITGAAIGSVVTAVAANLYTSSVSRAHQALVTTLRPALGIEAVAVGDTSPRGAATRRALLSTAVVFVVAGAFLAGVQLATGKDVSGTSVGTRANTALPTAPGGSDQQPGSDVEPATGSPTSTAPATPVPDETTAPESAPPETESPPATTVPDAEPTSDPPPVAPTASEPAPTPAPWG